MREMSLLEQLEIAEEVLETDEGFKCKLKKKKEELKNVERHKKDLKKSILIKKYTYGLDMF